MHNQQSRPDAFSPPSLLGGLRARRQKFRRALCETPILGIFISTQAMRWTPTCWVQSSIRTGLIDSQGGKLFRISALQPNVATPSILLLSLTMPKAWAFLIKF